MDRELFDLDFRLEAIAQGGDPLIRLNREIDWERFRIYTEAVRPAERKSSAGRKPFDSVMMFKIMILQSLYNLSDDAVEYQIRDRLSFMRFLGLSLADRVPDAKTVWLFRDRLSQEELTEPLFGLFEQFLTDKGYAARRGQIIDASIVAAPRQRNTREENEQVKAGQTPEKWHENPAKLRQKDMDARWTEKNDTTYYGYKNHISVDVKHKFIRSWAVTDAAVHDSQVFYELIDQENSCQELWADSAYRSAKSLELLEQMGMREHLQRKGNRGRALTEWEKQGNRTRARIRARVEHVFGIQAMRAVDLIVRTVGIMRARCKIGLRNLAYNIDRFAMLKQREARA
jgi:IS5 family transposase